MKLYYHPLSPNCHKVLLALYEKDVPFQGEVINLMDPGAHAAYRRDLNPLGKVPLLVLDEGTKIPESSIIAEYIDAHHMPGPRLFSDDKDVARQIHLIDRMSDMYLLNGFGLAFVESTKPADKQSPHAVSAAREQAKIALGILNKDLGSRQFAVGDRFTFADIALSSALAFVQLTGYPLREFAALQTYLDGITKRPSWQRVQREAVPFVEMMRPR